MDYVVFGTGYGATLMLLGWALRTFGPELRYRNDDEDVPLHGGQMMARLSWRRFASALGAVIATSGIILILLTFVLMFANPGDNIGTWGVLICFALILIAVAAWAWFFLGRYGTHGILPERRISAPFVTSRADKRRNDVQPAPSATLIADSAESATRNAPATQPTNVNEEQDTGPFESLADDDVYSDEQVGRYAKYQMHHPEAEQHAYDGLFSPDDDDDSWVDDVQAKGISITPDEDDVVDPAENKVEEPARESDIQPADDDDDEEDVSIFDDRPQPASSLTGDLQDTPEGRAEALRRIQSWQPDDTSKDGQS